MVQLGFFLTTLCRGQDSNLRKRVAPFLRDLSKDVLPTELPDRGRHTLLILTHDLNSLACIRPRSSTFWEVIQFSAFGQLSSEPKSGRRFPWKAEQCERGKKVENGHSVFFVRPGNETDSRHPLKKLFSFWKEFNLLEWYWEIKIRRFWWNDRIFNSST